MKVDFHHDKNKYDLIVYIGIFVQSDFQVFSVFKMVSFL